MLSSSLHKICVTEKIHIKCNCFPKQEIKQTDNEDFCIQIEGLVTPIPINVKLFIGDRFPPNNSQQKKSTTNIDKICEAKPSHMWLCNGSLLQLLEDSEDENIYKFFQVFIYLFKNYIFTFYTSIIFKKPKMKAVVVQYENMSKINTSSYIQEKVWKGIIM